MRVSVVLCTYSPEMYDHLREAAESVLRQTYEDVELVVIVDGDATLCEMVEADFGQRDDIRIHCNQENRGLSFGRNTGAEMASGEIVAFLDDDAVADDRWIEELVAAYARHDADAVGGRMAPRWIAGQPQFLPEEFYFLIGVTHRGFPTTEREVRNTFSSNLSFRRDVFLELGGFREHMGKRGSNDLQGGETELCVRLRETTDNGVIYTPEAVVAHKVFDHRTKLGWLMRRAFWQGYSKRMMQSDLPVPIDREWGFLGQLLTTFIPHRMRSLLRRPSVTAVTQLATLGMLVLAVGVGYLSGIADDLS